MSFSRTINNVNKNDRDTQELMYTNISLLNMVYPPSEEFKSVFKKDMFSKSNKSAFIQVVYYLLTILNSDVTKQKITTWPTLGNINRENKFRTEVLHYLNQLNTLYDNADLPSILSSHLVAPGGQRFIYFMYKLSELVLYEDLKKTYGEENILERPKLNNKNEELNTKLQEDLIKKTKVIKHETDEIIKKFKKQFKIFNKEAENTLNEIDNKYVNELKKITSLINIEKEKFQNKYELSRELLEKKEISKDKIKIIDQIEKVYNEFKTLLINLMEYTEKGVPLNSIESIRILRVELEKELTELPIYTNNELEDFLNVIIVKEKELKNLEKKIKKEQETFQETMNNSKLMLKDIISDLENSN